VLGELSMENFLLVTNQVGHDLAILSIDYPDHVVLASCQENRGLFVPLKEVEILLSNRVDRLLQCEAFLDIPHSQLVVKSSSDKKLSGRIELAILNRLCVTL